MCACSRPHLVIVASHHKVGRRRGFVLLELAGLFLELLLEGFNIKVGTICGGLFLFRLLLFFGSLELGFPLFALFGLSLDLALSPFLFLLLDALFLAEEVLSTFELEVDLQNRWI